MAKLPLIRKPIRLDQGPPDLILAQLLYGNCISLPDCKLLGFQSSLCEFGAESWMGLSEWTRTHVPMQKPSLCPSTIVAYACEHDTGPWWPSSRYPCPLPPAGASICTRAETRAWAGAQPPRLLDAGGKWVAFVTCAVRALRVQMRTDRVSAGL